MIVDVHTLFCYALPIGVAVAAATGFALKRLGRTRLPWWGLAVACVAWGAAGAGTLVAAVWGWSATVIEIARPEADGVTQRNVIDRQHYPSHSSLYLANCTDSSLVLTNVHYPPNLKNDTVHPPRVIAPGTVLAVNVRPECFVSPPDTLDNDRRFESRWYLNLATPQASEPVGQRGGPAPAVIDVPPRFTFAAWWATVKALWQKIV